MNNILSEKDYQKYILERLQENGYIVRPTTAFDKSFAIDRELLFKFLNNTQPSTMDALKKIFKDKLEETIVNFINSEMTKSRGSLLNVLKHGVELANYKLNLMYIKPATTFNKELLENYNKNIFSVMEEVWASDKERVDVVVFLNGLAIMSFELKCNFAGQSYEDAIYQYRTERNPKTRLFLFKAGCLVNFAMDLNEVYMTTKLDGQATFFLPFNMGNGEGVNTGKGNPVYEDKYSVSYMWEDILTKETVLDLINKFIFIETKEFTDEITGKKKIKETLIFPRYHQLDVIRKLLADVGINKTSQNYLIQHSAGSGKTNSIAWLAHRLSSLHDADNKIIYDNIIVVTDRIVVDRQLQSSILGIEHKTGLIRVMDDKCSSADLAIALKGNTKIIATTIQKFPYIVDSVSGLKEKKFAVIIDEAHSSTSGKDMSAITMTLGAGEADIDMEGALDSEDIIVDEISRNGKQPNVSFFAFTATPKPTTLQLFGKVNAKGQREAFHNQILNDEFSNWFRHQYLLYYLALLVMTDININHKNLPLYQKELSFVKYFHEQIGILSDRETNLAKLFFNYGTNIKFFGKIQKGRKDIIKNLKNMAWDIFHLQNTFNNLFIIPKNADFIIPFFISYDQRLKDIAPIYKLKSAAFIKNGFNKHLNFLTDLIDPTIKYEYFTAQAYLKRQEKLKDATEVSIIAKLQIEIEKYEKFLGL